MFKAMPNSMEMNWGTGDWFYAKKQVFLEQPSTKNEYLCTVIIIIVLKYLKGALVKCKDLFCIMVFVINFKTYNDLSMSISFKKCSYN